MKPRVRRTLVLFSLTALLVAAVATGRHLQAGHAAAAQQQPAPVVPVTTARATRERMPIIATGIGSVTPIYSVLVRPRVDGALDQVTFREGQDVKAGMLLARIDPRLLQAQLAQYEAQKARDEAQLANALVDLDRYVTLAKQDSIAGQQVDTQRALVNQARATVKLDQAQIDNARVQLDYTQIRAPVSGRTGKRLVDPGNIVHAADSTGLVTINQIDPISVVFTLAEDRFQALVQSEAANRGQPLTVQAYGRTDHALLATGRLTLVNNQIDSATGTFQLRAEFPNASNRLWPGQYVNVDVVLRELPDAVTIPDAAVQRGPAGLFAYVVGPDATAAVAPLTVTQSAGGTAIVASGITPGQHVVVDGQLKLRPGTKVAEAAGH